MGGWCATSTPACLGRTSQGNSGEVHDTTAEPRTNVHTPLERNFHCSVDINSINRTGAEPHTPSAEHDSTLRCNDGRAIDDARTCTCSAICAGSCKLGCSVVCCFSSCAMCLKPAVYSQTWCQVMCARKSHKHNRISSADFPWSTCLKESILLSLVSWMLFFACRDLPNSPMYKCWRGFQCGQKRQ